MTYSYFVRKVGIVNRNTDIVMGVLPANAIILNPYLSVPTAFNSGGADTIIIGNSTNNDAYGETKTVSAIITLANFTAGAEIGFLAAGKKVLLRYTSTGGAPTAGAAIVILPFLLVPGL